MNIKARLDLPIDDLIESLGLNERGRVQKYIDNFVLYHSEPYEPGKHIHQSGISATKIGEGQIIWNSPDANYLYEGKLMVDAVTFSAWARPHTQKIMDPKGRDLKYHGGGLRGKQWFDRMIQAEEKDLLNGISKTIGVGK